MSIANDRTPSHTSKGLLSIRSTVHYEHVPFSNTLNLHDSSFGKHFHHLLFHFSKNLIRDIRKMLLYFTGELTSIGARSSSTGLFL
jgi:hypothetical protein